MSKIITIAQQKGGTGKTTIAAQLSIAFKKKYKKIILVDIDPQASLSYWYNLRKQNLKDNEIQIDCIRIAGWKASSELSKLKSMYDLIIVDCPPHTDSDTKTVIRNADLVIIPLQPSPTDLWATQITIELAKNEDKSIILLLNRITYNSKIAKNIIDALPALPLLKLNQRIAYANSMIDGKSVIETEPKSNAASELNQLMNTINKFLK